MKSQSVLSTDGVISEQVEDLSLAYKYPTVSASDMVQYQAMKHCQDRPNLAFYSANAYGV